MEINIRLLQEAYDYLNSLPDKAYEKVNYNMRKVKGGIMDKDLFKKLDGTDIWEFRTKYNGMEYRLLAFWDAEEKALVIATHGFTKKTQKTPQREIDRAEKLRKEYFNSK